MPLDPRRAPTWTRQTPRVHTREARVNGWLVFLRLDGRGDGWRVDVASPPIPAWEAVDDGDPLPTLKAAKAFAARWLCAARTQETLTPRVSKETR